MLLNNSILTSKFCKHITDGTHDSPKYISSGYHLVTSKYIKSNKLDLDSSPFISQEDFDKINQRSKIENGDILFSMIGTVGDVAIVKNPNFAIKNMGLFRCCNQIDSLFLFYFFQSTNAHNLFNSLMTGSTQQYLTLNALKNIPIPNYSNELKQHIVDTI